MEYNRIAAFLLPVLFAASCIGESAGPQNGDSKEIAFAVEVEKPFFVYREPTKSVIASEDGTIVLPLTCKVTEGILMAPEATKAAMYSELESIGNFKVTSYDGNRKVIDDKTVKYYPDEDKWLLEDNPKSWLAGHSMNFFAYANLPSGSSISAVGSDSQTFECTIQSTAAAQKDAMLGYYGGDGNGEGVATLKFNHPLTAVIFKIGNIVEGDRTHTVTGIESITLKGVYASGTAVASGEGDVLSYDWGGSRSSTADVSEPLSGPVGTVGEPFLLIPQDLSEANVTIEALLTTADGTKLSQAVLKSGTWESGKTNTYVLGYTDYISVESISLNKTSTVIKKTDDETLQATILPADADDQTVVWTTSDPAVATVDEYGKVTAVGVGTCTITATPADGVAPATCTVTVINPVVSIVLDNIDLVLAQEGEHNNKTLVATVTYYDGTVKKSNSEKCVSWSSSNENVATVSEEGGLVLARIDQGTSYSTIRATTIDHDEFGNPMTAECSLNVPYFSIATTCYITNGTSGTMYTQAIAHSNTGMTPVNIVYYVDNTYNGGTLEYVYLTDSSTGQVQGHYVGTGRVYAVADYGNGIVNVSNDCIVTVGPAEAEQETTMSLSPEIMILSPQEEAQAMADMHYHLGQSWKTDRNVNWTTSNPGVAVVNASGIVTGVGAGTCTITATSQYLPTSGERVVNQMTVIVNNEAHITLNRTALGLLKNDVFDLTAKVTHTDGSKDANVSWSSTNSSVATVDNTGHVVAVAEGECDIVVTSNINPEITAACHVTVSDSNIGVTGIELSKAVIVIGNGSSGELSATIQPLSATNQNIIWSSSCTNVATVTANGSSCNITATGIGKAYVTATSEDGGYSASCEVIVPGVVIPGASLPASTTGNTVNGIHLFGTKGSTSPVYFSIFPADAGQYIQSVSWTSSNSINFEINWDGPGTNSNTGTLNTSYSFPSNETTYVQVSLSTGQTLVSNTTSVFKQTGTFNTIKDAIVISPTSVSLRPGELSGIAIAVPHYLGTATYKNTNVYWSSTDDEVAVVVHQDGDLKIRALKPGTCKIIAKAAQDITKTAEISVTVTEP